MTPPKLRNGEVDRGAQIREEWEHFRVTCAIPYADALTAVAAGLRPPIKPSSVQRILDRQDRKAAA